MTFVLCRKKFAFYLLVAQKESTSIFIIFFLFGRRIDGNSTNLKDKSYFLFSFFFFTEKQFSNLVHCQSMSHRPFIWLWNKVCVFSCIQNFQNVVWFDSYSTSIKFCQRISNFEGIRIFQLGENLLV